MAHGTRREQVLDPVASTKRYVHGRPASPSDDGKGFAGGHTMARVSARDRSDLTRRNSVPNMSNPVKGESDIRILLVDDNRDVLQALSAIFQLLGFAVSPATSGNAALKSYVSAPAEVALIDLGMPQGNGFELARELRRIATKPLLLIAMTGWPRPNDIMATRLASFDHNVLKPIYTDALELLIHSHVTRAQRSVGTSPPPLARQPLRRTDILTS
jgi:two-component system OmpR family response regulator